MKTAKYQTQEWIFTDSELFLPLQQKAEILNIYSSVYS